MVVESLPLLFLVPRGSSDGAKETMIKGLRTEGQAEKGTNREVGVLRE